ncbi:MAG: FAD-binding oxidoreductase, partial [Candidatus Dormibacteraceae bacterium]
MPTALATPVLEPGSDRYATAVAGYNLAARHRSTVVVPDDEDGLGAAVRLAHRQSRTLAVQATGHGTLGSPENGLLILTGRLTRIDIDMSGRTARVGAGVRWGDLVDRCAAVGLAPLGMASERSVGVVGYTLGGGTGPFARSQGFAADHVLSLELVDSTGTRWTIDQDRDPDLFWALRGGRDGFGVVSALTLRLIPAPPVFAATASYRRGAIPAALAAYAGWQRAAPDVLSSDAQLLRAPGSPPSLQVDLVFAGPAAEGRRWLERLTEVAQPDHQQTFVGSPAHLLHSRPAPRPLPLWSRSTVLDALPAEVVPALLDVVGPEREVPLLAVEVRPLGGVAARPPVVPNAVGGRDAAALVNVIAAPNPALFESAVPEVAGRLFDRLAPWSRDRSLLNFDPLRSPSCWDGATYARLEATRR